MNADTKDFNPYIDPEPEFELTREQSIDHSKIHLLGRSEDISDKPGALNYSSVTNDKNRATSKVTLSPP